MRWGMQYLGVGVKTVLGEGQRSGIAGRILVRKRSCQSMHGITVSQEMSVAISGQYEWVKRGRQA
eukprot:6426551-Karenia_brevis.AAC.1